MWRCCVVVMAAGCLGDPTVRCQDGRVCPVDTVCTTDTELCVAPEQITACIAMPDGAPCVFQFGEYACSAGICERVLCGDGRVIGPEVCDDGNQTSGDGCAADCRSAGLLP